MKNIALTKAHKNVSFVVALALWSPTVFSSDWICSGTNFWSETTCWSPTGVPGLNENAYVINSGATDIVVDYDVNAVDPLRQLRVDATGSGLATLSQTSNLALSAGLAIIGVNGQGNVVHTQGTGSYGDIVIGSNAGSNGQYELGGTAVLSSTGTLVIGDSAGANGDFLQTGGTVTADQELKIGEVAGSNGSYTLSGGSLTVNGEVAVARWGNASFVQTGGSHTALSLRVGRKTGSGIYTLSAGSLSVATSMEVGTIPNGSGTFVQTGGTVELTDAATGILKISASGGAAGLYQLQGGSLTASSIVNNDTLEFTGGSLIADIQNVDTLRLGGAGTRNVQGSIYNVGTTTFQPGTIFEETVHGRIELADGTLVAVDTDLTLENEGTLAIELGSDFFGQNSSPWMTVGGNALLGGILDLTNIMGWGPTDGDSWTVMEAGMLSGEFASILFPVIPNWTWDVVYLAGANGSVTLTGATSAVPVPAAVWLFGSGLLGLVGVARRRQG